MRTFKFNGSDVISLGDGYPDERWGTVPVAGHIFFGPKPKVGDRAISKGEAYDHVFEFTGVKHCMDPKEMYTGEMQRVVILNKDGSIADEYKEPSPLENIALSMEVSWAKCKDGLYSLLKLR